MVIPVGLLAVAFGERLRIMMDSVAPSGADPAYLMGPAAVESSQRRYASAIAGTACSAELRRLGLGQPMSR